MTDYSDLGYEDEPPTFDDLVVDLRACRAMKEEARRLANVYRDENERLNKQREEAWSKNEGLGRENIRLRNALAEVGFALDDEKGIVPLSIQATCDQLMRALDGIQRDAGGKPWFCPNHGYTLKVRHESHSQTPYCIVCGCDVQPIQGWNGGLLGG